VESKVAFVHGAQGSMNVERSVVVHSNLTVTARAFGRPVLMPELEGRTLQSVAELEEVLELVRQARPCQGLLAAEFPSAALPGEHAQMISGQGFEGEHVARFNPVCLCLLLPSAGGRSRCEPCARQANHDGARPVPEVRDRDEQPAQAAAPPHPGSKEGTHACFPTPGCAASRAAPLRSQRVRTGASSP
jgi:hypothetical protein